MIACVNGTQLRLEKNTPVVQGTIGQSLGVKLSEEWSALSVTAVFSAGAVKRDVIVESDELTIPWELLAEARHALNLSFHGAQADGRLVLRTNIISLGDILPSQAPSGNEAEAPTPTRADQIQALAEQAVATARSAEGTLDALLSDAQAAVDAVVAEGTRQSGLLDDEAAAQLSVIDAAGQVQVDAVQSRGDTVLASIPADYKTLDSSVTALGHYLDTEQLFRPLAFGKNAWSYNGSNTPVAASVAESYLFSGFQSLKNVGEANTMGVVKDIRVNQRPPVLHGGETMTFAVYVQLEDGVETVTVAVIQFSTGINWNTATQSIASSTTRYELRAGWNEVILSVLSESSAMQVYPYMNIRVSNLEEAGKIKGMYFFQNADLLRALTPQSVAAADYAGSAGTSQLASNAGFASLAILQPSVYLSPAAQTLGMTLAQSWEKYLFRCPAASSFSAQTYGIVSFNIKSLFGKGYTLRLAAENPGWRADINPSEQWFFNEIHLSRVPFQWGTYDILNLGGSYPLGNAATNQYYVELDSLEIDASQYTNIYFLFSAFRAPGAVVHQAAEITLRIDVVSPDNLVIATKLLGFDPADYYTRQELDAPFHSTDYITCWGDSLTAAGGWTSTLGALAGMPVYNGGTGGEDARTIAARQGADVMLTDGITIPASKSQTALIASRATDGGILTAFGHRVTPLLQGGAHVNPVRIGQVEGTLRWTGSSYADTDGTWTFQRAADGDEVTIDRPTAIVTDFDRNRNAPYLMVLFIGQNGGYADLDELVRQHRLMIEHAKAKHVLVLGLSSGTAASRAAYEARMKQEFGRCFVSLREYLAHPIYGAAGEITSCYGLADQALTPTSDYVYNGVTYDALAEIAAGTVPHMMLADNVHYTAGTQAVIGNMLYKKCCELGIF